MPRYERLYGLGVDFDKFYDATVVLLGNLFSDSRYGENERQVLGVICRGIENFISGEIFTRWGAIKVCTPQESDETHRLFYRLAAAYFLHCRWNAKLERCQPEKYNLEVADEFLYGALTRWHNEEQWNQVDRNFFEMKNFFQNLHRLSFRFVSPLSGLEYVWKGSAYSPNDRSRQIEIKARYTDYGAYLRFLLTKKGNHIENFADATRTFWRNFIKLGRAREPYRLEDTRTADMDLILICLSLALNEEVFNTLVDLRDKTYPGINPVNPRTPVIFGEHQLEKLKRLLRISTVRLAEAKQQLNGNLENLPRRLLRDANITMLRDGQRPIINLEGADEVNEVRDLIGKGISEDLFNQTYIAEADGNLRLNPENF